MVKIKRVLKAPETSFFLFGPRASSKSIDLTMDFNKEKILTEYKLVRTSY